MAACYGKQLYLRWPMNALIVGTNKRPILDHLDRPYLLIDDGPLIDQVPENPNHHVLEFDVLKHSFNPLKDMSYKRARVLLDVLNAVFPEGENTLTRKNSNFILLRALLDKPERLDNLTFLSEMASKEGVLDAEQKIQTLLLSPVLKDILTRPTNMSFKGTIHARLDRALLGDFDAFVIGNLLISQYQGLVFIPDFGFYACRFHSTLLRQGRLVAGVNTLDERPDFRNQLLLIEEKIASHATAEDAKVLALYAGLLPGTNGYNHFIDSCIK